MPTFEFRCRKCGLIFIASKISESQSKAHRCLECGSIDLEQLGFDHSDSPHQYLLSQALGETEARLVKRIQRIEAILEEVAGEIYNDTEQDGEDNDEPH